MTPPAFEPIAIVGMACRFPGAPSLADFWTALRAGRDGMRPVPADRWDADALYAADAKTPGKVNSRSGAFVDDIDRFDAAFFGISPREATQMDPQQRVLLELAYEAFEDAGLAPARLAGTDTSVYVGAMTNDYLRHQIADGYRRIDVHTGSGAGLCMLANRVSYQFDLRGPSVALDSACSSSLVAVFHACESLWTGQSRVALAGGVSLMLDPAFNVFYAKAGLSAPDGKCKTFAAAADGIGRGEGAGVVVLKRLADALADDDRIYAVIRGGAVNHDGRSNGLTQPNRWAQEQLLRRAFAHAAIDARELQYVELHGTGTLIGDPIEANALAAVLMEAGERDAACLVGSVKSNIGHLEAAAGIAGLIKLALGVFHAEVPPSLWFDAPNPHIAFDRMPIRMNTAHVSWPTRNGRRLGGISSFGLGGTNAHLVLESAPTVHAEYARPLAAAHHWLFLSARSEAALAALATRYIEFLTLAPEHDAPAVCGTALRRKGIHDFRLSVIGPDKAALIERLQAFVAGAGDDARIFHGRFRPGQRRLLLAVPDHGRIDTNRLAHWLAPAPLARAAWDVCRAMLRDFSNVLLPPADEVSAYPNVVDGSPDFRAWHFASHYALLTQLLGGARGTEAIVADGIAQLAAFCAAGALPLPRAIEWLGASLSPDFITRQVLPAPDFSVVCDCPSGRNPAFTAIDWNAGARPWHERLKSIDAANADVLVLNLGDADNLGAWREHDIGGAPDGFQRVHARLSVHHALEWDACTDNRGFVRLPSYPWQRESYWLSRAASSDSAAGSAIAAPSIAATLTLGSFAAPDHAQPAHALLATRVPSPTPAWESRLDRNRLTYLADHHVQGLTVLPGAAYAEIGLAIHNAINGAEPSVLEDLEFHKALVIGKNDTPIVHAAYDASRREYTVHSQRRAGDTWKLHARGRLSLIPPAPAARVSLAELQQRCCRLIATGAHYHNMDERGLEYGQYFRGVRRLWLDASGAEVLAWIEGDERLTHEDHGNRLHPTLFDASLQTLLAPLGARGDSQLYIPVAIRQLQLYRAPKNGFWCHGTLKHASDQTVEGDVVLFEDDGGVIARAYGARAQALTKKENDELKHIDQWLYEFIWEKAPAQAPPRRAGNWLVFMDGDANGEPVAQRLAAAGADSIIRVLPGDTFEQLSATTFVVAPDDKADLQRVLDGANAIGVEGIAYLWSLDVPKADGVPAVDALPVVHLLQLLAQPDRANPPRLIVVTRAAYAVDADQAVESVAHAPLIGLMRVAVNEYPQLRLRSIDIDGDGDTLSYLVEEMLSESREDETALRGAERYVHRLVRKHALDLDNRCAQPIPPAASARRAPRAGEVEVALRLATLGPDAAPVAAVEFGGVFGGWGVITCVGQAVQQLEAGDAVLVQLRGQHGMYVTVPAAHVVPLIVGDAIVVKNHAAYIHAFVSAYYALHHVARLQPGEKLLLPQATTPLGLAAIQVARALGASVYATATAAEQCDYLRTLGIEHVYQDDSLDFADRIMADTGGRGVDVVLNTWTGEYADKAHALLAPLGRFIDLSADTETRAAKTGPNRSIAAIDMRALLTEQPELLPRVLAEVCERFRAKVFSAIPARVAPLAEAALEAVNAPARIGAAAISFGHDPKALLAPADLFHSKGTYLITGGFGGFGLEIAAWMIEHGARHLVLAGRRGADTAGAQQALDTLRARGAQVLAVAADVSSEADVKRLLGQAAEHMPPLKGVFHAAAVLDDRPIAHLARTRIDHAMGAKAHGAWYLHRHTLEAKLDYFVLFSSIASMTGGPGQASYAMACAYLDALARLRRARNLPAISVNWGALGQVGMAARHADVETYLRASGVGLFTPGQATQVLGRILRWNPVELGAAIMDWALWGRSYPGWAASPKYAALCVDDNGAPAPTAERPLLKALADLDAPERARAIADLLAGILGETLQLAPEKIDRNLSLLSIGIDSLMAMELQAGVDKSLGVKISTLELMKGNSIIQLAQHVVLLLEHDASAAVDTGASAAPGPRALHLDDAGKIIAQLDHLSDAEVDQLLEKLSASEAVAG